MTLYVGTSGYAYKEWKGSFYPDKLPAKDMLRFYSKRFRTVEINNTFYRTPKSDVMTGWAADVPANFRFVVKAPQRITHFQRLKGSEESLQSLLDVAGAIKERLGPLLFQLPPNMKKDLGRLRDFLALLPPRRRAAFEFRHASWLDHETFTLLRENNVALCLADADDDLEVPFEATADWGYLRLRRDEYTSEDLKKWAKRVVEQAWMDAFVFFKHEDEGKGPKFAAEFLSAAEYGPSGSE